MPKISDFYSISEVLKPPEKGVYHNNSACPQAREIPAIDRRVGTANYRLCEDCLNLNAQGR
jgi:hypothetical protein